MYFFILCRAPTWYWVSFFDLQFQTERLPSFLLEKGYRFSICYRFHFTSDLPENLPLKKAGHEPAGRHVRRFSLLYCLLSSNILFLISHNSNFMWYTKENCCYDKYDVKWQKDISFVILIKTAVVAHGGAKTKSALASSKTERPNPKTIKLPIVTRILLLAIYRSFNKSPFIIFPPLHREA